MRTRARVGDGRFADPNQRGGKVEFRELKGTTSQVQAAEPELEGRDLSRLGERGPELVRGQRLPVAPQQGLGIADRGVELGRLGVAQQECGPELFGGQPMVGDPTRGFRGASMECGGLEGTSTCREVLGDARRDPSVPGGTIEPGRKDASQRGDAGRVAGPIRAPPGLRSG